MYVAVNSEKERIHISNTKENERYFCPICGEEVVQRRGDTNADHFAHKNNSRCLERDGWHYDMSEWHYDWQKQFPVENQEVVFKLNGKVHRADVFIKNTVLEFQHSPISEAEFKDRNNFYKILGYKVIWVFDAIEKDIKHNYDYSADAISCCWNHPLRFLNSVNYNDPDLEVYLQVGEAIWYRQPNYKNSGEFKEVKIENNIIKICKLEDGIGSFLSDDYYSDFELIDYFLSFEFKENKKYIYKKSFDMHRLTDEIYKSELKNSYRFYGYCPSRKNEFYDHASCHECIYIDSTSARCMYRFRKLNKERITEILDIKYDRDGRIRFLELRVDGEVKQYDLGPIPYYTNSLLEFAEKKNNLKVARFINVKSEKVIQLTGYNLRMLINNKKCIGKLCDNEFGNASSKEFEIYYWDKPIWILIWFIEEGENDY